MFSGKSLRHFAVGTAVLAIVACASAPPQETHDGLVLQADTRFSEVYRKPGADLTGFEAYGLLPCDVAFKANWMRDQNRDRASLNSRVTQKDVDRIKDNLSAQCDTHFRAALEEDPAYKLLDSFDEGEAVLVLHPAIIDLDISAPDVSSAGRSRSYTTSSGEMTLYLEILDGTTGEILVRAVDRRKNMDTGRMQWTNSVTNKSDADRALRRWADQLRKGLDEVSGS
jgi:hypothetical protein